MRIKEEDLNKLLPTLYEKCKLVNQGKKTKNQAEEEMVALFPAYNLNSYGMYFDMLTIL